MSKVKSALHVRSERNGLIGDQPVLFWNSDTLLIEGTFKLPVNARSASDFAFRLDDQLEVTPDSFLPEKPGLYRIKFRLAAPKQSCLGQLLWKQQILAERMIEVVTQEDYLEKLQLQLVTLFVRIGTEDRSAQTVVKGQAKAIRLAAVLRHPLGLWGMDGFPLQLLQPQSRQPIRLSPEQFRSTEAMISVTLPIRKEAKIEAVQLEVRAGGKILAQPTFRLIDKKTFEKSIRISDTRYIYQRLGEKLQVSRSLPPLAHLHTVGPIFLVRSDLKGMAGAGTFQVRLRLADKQSSNLLYEQKVELSEIPVPITPGTLPVEELLQVQGFELWFRRRLFGYLPLQMIPQAQFTAEGGFQSLPEFQWNSFAEQELEDRLRQLLERSGE